MGQKYVPQNVGERSQICADISLFWGTFDQFMIKNHSKKESITGAVVNKKPMTAPLNLNPADETTASLGLQHAGHIIRSILYTSDYRKTNNRDKANKPVTYLMCYPEGLRAILPWQPSADYFKECQELLAKALTAVRLNKVEPGKLALGCF